MHREWCASLPAEIGAPMKARLQRLYDFLSSGLLRSRPSPTRRLAWSKERPAWSPGWTDRRSALSLQFGPK